MTYDIFIALLGFGFVTSVTPGPNNMMLLASGVNFGFRRTLPHMFGISVGHSVMVFLVGMGLAGVVHSWPPALLTLKVVSVVYMLWLAWKIANAGAPSGASSTAAPMTFLQAAAFQWINPKAWAMALTATANYAPSGSVTGVALVAMVFAIVNLPSVSIWAWGGEAVRGWLQNPKALRAFNWTMAALLVLSLIPVVLMQG
jgi:threonine/homoserine/homoserine lactone efflux protein